MKVELVQEKRDEGNSFNELKFPKLIILSIIINKCASL